MLYADLTSCSWNVYGKSECPSHFGLFLSEGRDLAFVDSFDMAP